MFRRNSAADDHFRRAEEKSDEEEEGIEQEAESQRSPDFSQDIAAETRHLVVNYMDLGRREAKPRGDLGLF